MQWNGTYVDGAAQCPSIEINYSEAVSAVKSGRHCLPPNLNAILAPHPLPHYTQLILVHGDNVPVLQNVLVLLANIAQVIGHEERRRPDGPEGQLGPTLI